MKNKKTNLLLILFVISTLQVSAQKNAKEFSIYGGGGASLFLFTPPVPTASSIGYHADLGFGFTHFFSQTVGFHIGAGFGLNNINAKVGQLIIFTPKLSGIPDYLSFEGYEGDLHTTLYNYTENHQTMFVSIPVMFQFQTKQKQQLFNWRQGKRAYFYAMTGVKMLILLDQKYEAAVKSLNNLVYFPELDNWAGTQTFAGLGTFNNNGKGYNANGTLGVGILAVFAFETGVKWRIGEKLYLYTGIYLDCGLNDPTKNSRQPLNNYYSEKLLSDLALLAFTDRINLMGAGIKLRLAFYQPPKREPCHYIR